MTELAADRELGLFGEGACYKLLSDTDFVYTHPARPVDVSASCGFGFFYESAHRLRGHRSMIDELSGSMPSGVVRLVVTGRVSDATWFQPTLESARRLHKLTAEASSHGEAPMAARSAAHLFSFLSQALEPDAAAPSLAPLSEGGIQAEWHRGGVDVEVLVSDDESESGVYVRDKVTGAEVEFPLDPGRFREIIRDRLSLAV